MLLASMTSANKENVQYMMPAGLVIWIYSALMFAGRHVYIKIHALPSVSSEESSLTVVKVATLYYAIDCRIYFALKYCFIERVMSESN